MRKQGARDPSLHRFVDELRQYLISTRDASTAESGAREGRIAAWLALVTEVADMLTSGVSVAYVEELSRSRLRSQMAAWTERSAGLAELSAIRAAALDLRLRADSAARRDDEGLKMLHAAVDVVIAAAAREDESRTHADPNAAERELALGELESLLAASPVGIAFLDPALRYVRINEALAAINGSSAAAHIGRSIMEMLPNEAHVIEPMLRDVIATGRPVMNREFTRARAEEPGELRSYLATFCPVRARSGQIIGVGGLVADITETRRAEHDLRRTQERMQSILAHTPASIWLTDESGRIVLANQQLADALGHPYDQIIGRRSEDLLPPALAAEHRAHDLTVVREHRAIEVEEEVPAPEGVRTFLSIKFPLPGDPPMVGGIATDISDRKRMEAQLRLAVRSREKVLAAVSHDLRNPLNTIQFTSATLLTQLGDDLRWRRHLEIIQRSCNRMGRLIADLLDMVSIDAGRLSIDTRPERADDLLREAFELHQVQADEKQVTLRLCPIDEDVWVHGDRQRLLQVFDNLVGNALKFCRASDTVTLGGERVQAGVRFWVEDTGPGIAPSLMTHLFDPYWSGPDTRNGVGLGLYISRGIVARHGGEIDVHSAVGSGSRFTFTIPFAEAADAADAL